MGRLTGYRIKAASIFPIAAIGFAAGCSNSISNADDVAVISNDDIARVTALEVNPEQESPLSPYWALLWGIETMNINAINHRSLAAEARIQELVAQCMHDAGFEFIINLPENNPVGFNPDLWRQFDPDWIAQYGFGIIVAPTENMPLPGGQDAFAMGRNREMLEGFSDAKQAEWYLAYIGTGDFDSSGCLQWAMSQENQETGFGFAAANDEFAPLLDAIFELDNNLRVEREQSEWMQDWSHCMADAGHPGLQRVGDERTAFRAHMHESLGTSFWDTLIDSPDLVITPQAAELRAEEIAVAFTSLDCQATVDFWGRDHANRVQAEQQFINVHRLALNALRDAIEQRNPVSS